jgi:hypothetical protein
MKKTPAKKQPIVQLDAQILLDVKPDTPSYYVNYIGISHTAYDITLSAVKIPSPLRQDQFELVKSGQQIPMEPLLQIVIPPLLLDGLIQALIAQKEQHQQTQEKQVKNNANDQHGKPSGPVQ